MPDAQDQTLQNLYFFNLCWSSRELVRRTAQAVAKSTGRVSVDVSSGFYSLGVEYADHGDFGSSSLHFAAPEQLVKLTQVGGYVIHGFNKLPTTFSKNFLPVGASMIVVRDPRDIGIALHYALTGRDLLENPKNPKKIENFLLRDKLIDEVNNLVSGYASIIQRGAQVIMYEDLCADGAPSIPMMADSVLERLSQFLPNDMNFQILIDSIDEGKSTENKTEKVGHSTYEPYAFTRLEPSLLEEYTRRLSSSIEIMGY